MYRKYMENDVYGNAEYSVLPCLESLARRVVFPGLVKNVPPESRDLFYLLTAYQRSNVPTLFFIPMHDLIKRLTFITSFE